MECEISSGPRLSLVRARQWLLLVGAALGFAAAGAPAVVGSTRTSAGTYLVYEGGPDCEFWRTCWAPVPTSPWESPPIAILPDRRRAPHPRGASA
jgi:hypothetical protein